MLHLDPLAPSTPRLPHQRLGPLAQLAASIALHVTVVILAAVMATTSAPGLDVRRAERIADQQRPDIRHIVFRAPKLQPAGSGGGGGGTTAAMIAASAPPRTIRNIGRSSELPTSFARITHAASINDLVIRSLAGGDLFNCYCASCHGVDGKGGGRVVITERSL